MSSVLNENPDNSQTTLITDKEFYKVYNEDYYQWQCSNKGQGTCLYENMKLYDELNKKQNIDKLTYRRMTIERKSDHTHVKHCFPIYRENGELYMESRANGIHKKFIFRRWLKFNKIINSREIDVNYRPWE